MSRFTRTVLCAAALVVCLAALPLVSTGQEVTFDSQGRPIVTVPPGSSTPSPYVVKPDSAIPEGTVTIYSNFGSGSSYECCSVYGEFGLNTKFGPATQAMAFRPTKGTYLLTRLDLATTLIFGTNGYTLELRDDERGVPGGKLASWKVTGLPEVGSTSNTVQTVKVHGLIILLKGRRYWLVPKVNSDEWAGWNLNTVSAPGWIASSSDGGATWTTGAVDTNGAFDVLGRKLF